MTAAHLARPASSRRPSPVAAMTERLPDGRQAAATDGTVTSALSAGTR